MIVSKGVGYPDKTFRPGYLDGTFRPEGTWPAMYSQTVLPVLGPTPFLVTGLASIIIGDGKQLGNQY
jgi:hypothetical protein